MCFAAPTHKHTQTDMNICKPNVQRKIWKLKEYDSQQTFLTELQNCLVYNPESSVEEKWVALDKALLNATDKSCGWTKRPPRH